MKALGYLLVTLGFIVTALVSVLDTIEIDWRLYAVPLAVGIVGVFLLRTTLRRNAEAVEKHTGNIQNLTACLQRIVDRLAPLTVQPENETDSLDFHTTFDHTFASDLTAFADGRESIAHAHGLQAYADIMSSFAAAERYLNRVWSASADGYIDEVHTYLHRAHEQFNDSLTRLQQLTPVPTS
ncbi:hypothetical protein ACFL6U_19415 [Planctomycetota bacterium]